VGWEVEREVWWKVWWGVEQVVWEQLQNG